MITTLSGVIIYCFRVIRNVISINLRGSLLQKRFCRWSALATEEQFRLALGPALNIRVAFSSLRILLPGYGSLRKVQSLEEMSGYLERNRLPHRRYVRIVVFLPLAYSLLCLMHMYFDGTY